MTGIASVFRPRSASFAPCRSFCGTKAKRRRSKSGAARQKFDTELQYGIGYGSAALPSLRLVDIPKDRRCRTVEHAGQRFTPGARRQILAERDVDHLVVDFGLDVGCDLLLILRRRCAHELVAQRFPLGVLRPAEPAAVLATATDADICDGVHHVGAGPVGEEHVPAALLRRLLAGTAGGGGVSRRGARLRPL